ncbi:MAG: autotransporter-associated beta strand repeat-containing protein [Patescibacteria group bacterium]|nr:autotransporter-associated beta strand repeat-containing protein [Patescibacteria group bacterium]
MQRPIVFSIIALIALAGLLAVAEFSRAATVTWDGSTDMTWTEPDSTSWGTDTYAAGDTAQFFDAGAGTVSVAGVTPGAIVVNSTANYVFSGGAIGGTGTLTKAGSGTLTLSGANTYSGNTTVDGGTLQLGSATALGTTAGSTTVASGAVLDLNGQTVGAEALTLSGTGAGNGALTNSSATAASITGNTSTGSYSVGGTGNITLTGNVRGSLTKVNNNTLILAGTIDNAGLGVTLDAGTLFLAKTSSSGVHAIGGSTLTINNGTLVRITGTGGDQIYIGGDVQLNNGTFDLNGNSEGFDRLDGLATGTIVNNASGTAVTLTVGQDNSAGTFAGVIADNTSGTGTLALTKTGSGTLTLSGTNTYSGNTTVDGGTLKLGSAMALGTTVGTTTIVSGAVLDLNGQAVGAEALTLSGTGAGNGALTNSIATAASFAGNVNESASNSYSVGGTGDITLTGNVRGSLTKVNNNTLILAGTIDNNGLAVTVDAGTLLLAKTSSSSVHAIGGNTLTINNGALARITGPGGDQIFSEGNVQLNDGMFDLNGNSEGFDRLNGLATGTIVNNATGTAVTLTVGQNNGTGTFAGLIADNTSGTGTLALTKAGSGILTLSGANTYSGSTTVDGGTLKLGSATALGTTAGLTTVASGAVLDLNGQVVGAEVLSLGGTGAGNGALTNSSATAASIAGNVNTSGTGSYSVGGTGNITLTGNVRGSLTKVDNNTLILAGAIDNGGLGVTLNAGTLLLAKTSNSGVHAIGGSMLTINNGTLVRITGTGGDQIYFGGDVQLNNGTFDLNGNSEGFDRLSGLATGTIVNNATGTAVTLTVGQDNSTGTFAGVIADNTSGTGTLALTKDGSGTLTLSGANTYSGDTIVKSGILRLDSAGSLSFLIGPSGVNNAIYDAADTDATLYLDGSFDFNLSGAGTTLGDSWEIVDIDSFFNTDIFGSTFSVTGFTNSATGLWETSYAGSSYVFNQGTGLLTVVPEPTSFTLLALLIFGLLTARRRGR